MTTLRDIVNGAALRLRLIGPGETIDNEQGSDLLQALNDMFGSWEAKGINIGRSADLAIADDIPVGEKHVAGLKAMLARRYAEDAGKPVTAQLDMDAKDGWHAINADYRLPDAMRMDDALLRMPSQRRIY